MSRIRRRWRASRERRAARRIVRTAERVARRAARPPRHLLNQQAAAHQAHDPWGWGRSLEWVTPIDPDERRRWRPPPIVSESPAFDLHHPEARDDGEDVSQ